MAGSSSTLGTYPTTCTGAVDANYAISYTAGTLTIIPIPLLRQLVVLDGSASFCTLRIQAGTVTAGIIAVDGTNVTAAACLNAGTLSASSSISVVGGLRNHAATVHGTLTTHASPTADPFAGLAAATAPIAVCPGSACPKGPTMKGNGSFTLYPGTYTRAVTLNGTITACLMPASMCWSYTAEGHMLRLFHAQRSAV